MRRKEFRPDSLGILEPRLVPSGQAAQLADPPSVQISSRPAPTNDVARFEVRWLREMITHHGMAVRMANLALGNSGDTDIRSMARDIVRAQTREIAAMQRWLAGWYGVRGAVPRLAADDRAMLGEMRGLRGVAFDRMFLTHMIGHHESAIEDANRLLAGARHPRLLQLGRDVIRAQSAEVERMHAMLGHAGGMDGGGAHSG